jgi:2,4-dienoyl-CoA reductase (NADPH2)
MTTFSALMSPGRIGGLELRNRIIMTPMGSNLAQSDGHCGERIQAYYEARAKGGAALLIVGVGSIAWPVGSCNPNQVAISEDQFIPGLKQLTDRVHQHACKAAIQLQHAGQVAVCDMSAGRPLLVPSVPKPKKEDMTQALTSDELATYVKAFTKKGAKITYRVASKEDIKQLIEDFALAAERAQRAGFDGVEIHAGHGYIISSFLSPYSNQRDDEYGGSVENRARLLLEVLQAVRERVGKNFALWCRLDAREFRLDGGISLEDACQTARLAEQAGADAVHISAYANNASGIGFTEAPLVHKVAGFVDFAKKIKAAVSIPVIAVGRIEPELADKLVAREDVDFVAMGRKLLADPDLPNKLKAGQAGDIRPCIYCYTCVSQIFLNRPLRCAVNPFTGREYELAITPATERKKILVVGGGPAGMESARLLALRGHQVTLCEQGRRLGGTVFFSSFVYSANGNLIEQMERQIRAMNIDIKLEHCVDAQFIQQLKPDAVVIATGAKRESPDIPGADRRNVFNGDQLRKLMTGEDVSIAKEKLSFLQRSLLSAGALIGITRNAALIRAMSKFWMPVGKRVCIIGGGLVGVELAEFMLERGRQVVVLEEGEKFGIELAVVRRWRVLHEIRESGGKLVAGARVSAITDRGVSYHDAQGLESRLDIDTVIIALGAQANHDLADSLKGGDIPVHQIGDCSGMAYIDGAIAQATELALKL